MKRIGQWLAVLWLGTMSSALAATVHLAWDASAGAEGYAVRALPGPSGNDGRIFDVETNCEAVLDLAPGGWTIFVEAYTTGTNRDGTLYRIASTPSNAVRVAVPDAVALRSDVAVFAPAQLVLSPQPQAVATCWVQTSTNLLDWSDWLPIYQVAFGTPLENQNVRAMLTITRP